MKRRCAWLVIAIGVGLSGCASSGNPGGVLEPLEAARKADFPPEESLQSPQYQSLMTSLQRLGYEGIGMAYESAQTLDTLQRVFADPRAANRQIKLVYTGINMAYDPKHQSLTVGGALDPATILAFITKKVPARP